LFLEHSFKSLDCDPPHFISPNSSTEVSVGVPRQWDVTWMGYVNVLHFNSAIPHSIRKSIQKG